MRNYFYLFLNLKFIDGIKKIKEKIETTTTATTKMLTIKIKKKKKKYTTQNRIETDLLIIPFERRRRNILNPNRKIKTPFAFLILETNNKSAI